MLFSCICVPNHFTFTFITVEGRTRKVCARLMVGERFAPQSLHVMSDGAEMHSRMNIIKEQYTVPFDESGLAKSTFCGVALPQQQRGTDKEV